jgi:GxxExxY protein
MTDLLMQNEVYAIMGAAFDVHNELGAGFLEAVYQEAVETELSARCIPFDSQHPIGIKYKEQTLESRYYADLLCYGSIIVELKALSRLSSIEDAQVLNYLKATGIRLGLLVNFGKHPKLEWKRRVR